MILDNIFEAISLVLCALGLFMCIYILITKNVNTTLPANNLTLCFFGLGWLCFMLESVELSLGSFLGIICFFAAFVIWTGSTLHIFKRK